MRHLIPGYLASTAALWKLPVVDRWLNEVVVNPVAKVLCSVASMLIISSPSGPADSLA